MIVGTDWVFAHLPKTGGDAATRYLAEIAPSAKRDDTSTPRKHQPFSARPAAMEKRWKLLGIRRLPMWTWSLMHEFNVQAKLLRWHRVKNAAVKSFALSRPFGDEYLLSMQRHADVTHWLRQEFLLDDVVAFANRCIRPIDGAEIARLRRLRTKRGRRKGNPFTEKETATLYELNPHWARVEAQEYLNPQQRPT